MPYTRKKSLASKEPRPPKGRSSDALHRRKSTIRVVSLSLLALEHLCKAARGIGVRDLARALGVGKSTMHRILQTLQAHGLVRQDADTARYVITSRLMEMVSTILDNMEFRRVARPFLEELQERSGETVFLGILDSGDVVIVDRIDSQEALRMVNDIGFREPSYSTALGKTLLAGLEEKVLESRLAKLDFKRLTAKTVQSEEALKVDLNRVRLAGFAIDDEESTPAVRCVAAPVRDATGRVIAAVSVSGPSIRISSERIPMLAQDVRSTAETISGELGYLREAPHLNVNASEGGLVRA